MSNRIRESTAKTHFIDPTPNAVINGQYTTETAPQPYNTKKYIKALERKIERYKAHIETRNKLTQQREIALFQADIDLYQKQLTYLKQHMTDKSNKPTSDGVARYT